MGTDRKTAVLLVGFGGPTSKKEVKPFLESVLGTVKISTERFKEVLSHYEALGGVSPYNAAALGQKERLENWFLDRGHGEISVEAGFRHSFPSLEKTLLGLKSKKIQQLIVVILSSLDCEASFGRYQKKTDEALKLTGADFKSVIYARPLAEYPLFLEVLVDETSKALAKLDSKKTFCLFSAHSIPLAMSETSPYAAQFSKTAKAVAEKLGLQSWAVAYQSRSGSPATPWLAPSVLEMLEKTKTKELQNILLIPLGFVCDNVEILYDLDIEARKKAEECGWRYFRAATVGENPKFIEMIGSLVLEASQ
jgi:ferrochelatase